MPYTWNAPRPQDATRLTLWPHQSLHPRGLAAFVLATFTMITLPLYGLLGTALLWALLPFLMIAVGSIWYALTRSRKDREIRETLDLGDPDIELTRENPRTPTQNCVCNRYWTKVTLHPKGGPIPNYVTLSGNGREVEIGSFLSEPERLSLYDELSKLLNN